MVPSEDGKGTQNGKAEGTLQAACSKVLPDTLHEELLEKLKHMFKHINQ